MSSERQSHGPTYDEPEVKHPLTGQIVNIRNFINELVDSSRLDVLKALTDHQHRTPSDIEQMGEVSRQTASKHLADLAKRGLTNRGENPREQRITAGGKFVVQSLSTHSDVVSREQLALLTRSASASQLLYALSRGSVRPRNLAQEERMSPSRSTIQRTLSTFTCQGWCREDHGRYRLTSTGTEVLEAHRTIIDRTTQSVKKSTFLQRLSPARADFPPEALAEAEVAVSDPSSPGEALSLALKLCDRNLHHFRAFTSIYNARLFTTYYKIFNLGLDGEAIVDASVYQQIRENEQTAHLIDDSEYDRYRLLRLPDKMTLGIGIYDDRKVAIGAFNETGNGRHTAILLSSNDEFVEWGIDLYESIREQACRPSQQKSHPTQAHSKTS
ncbi:MarR family transcriptional regulator (plasmid) [Halorarum halophilum]|uniref:MarR family transcriptional regulator n=1 Tax=Halorarum halophilum TaxID=2743090 RepID=A0A7D5GIB9_9EURY|nr:MarR family transcriptional regulator [Halobaculum halophilum]QLG29830.1 MarR family transcriptional regulator [Halobaculum halophilum]